MNDSDNIVEEMYRCPDCDRRLNDDMMCPSCDLHQPTDTDILLDDIEDIE
jgi:rubrerythrin